MMGVGAGSSDHATLILSGTAGLVAGSLSMAVGEYISVSSQVRPTAGQQAVAGAQLPGMLATYARAGGGLKLATRTRVPQRDAEQADIERERQEQLKGPEAQVTRRNTAAAPPLLRAGLGSCRALVPVVQPPAARKRSAAG